jgi:hypothetical protein
LYVFETRCAIVDEEASEVIPQSRLKKSVGRGAEAFLCPASDTDQSIEEECTPG